MNRLLKLVFLVLCGINLVPGLLWAAGGSDENVEYLIITPLRYAPIFQQLAEWKTAKGVPAKVVTLEEILKKQTQGDVPCRIRDFIKSVYKAWNVKWVLLGGDTVDKDGVCLPVRFARSTMLNKQTDIPTDLYYANFDGNWDGNSNRIYGELKDGCDLVPEVFIARASVDSREEASTFVEKVLRYEKTPPANWVKKALLVGNNLDEQTSGKEEIDILAKECFPGFSIRKVSEDKGATADTIKKAFDTVSPHFVHVTAHGAPEGFGGKDFFSLEHADKLANTFPFIYVAMSCETNYFDKDCLSEHMMANPKGGAVAYWACSRYGWYQPNNEGYYFSTLLLKDFFKLLLNDPKGVSNHIGEAASRARLKYIDQAKKTDGVYRWLVFGMNLLGDPEMPVWTAEPAKMAVSARYDAKARQVTVNVTSAGKAVEGALVCLHYEDDQNLGLTVTGRNCLPIDVKVAGVGIPGLYAVGRTGGNGALSLALKSDTNVIKAKIERLVMLDKAIRDIEAYMQKIRSNAKAFAKLTGDYKFLQETMERHRREIRAFFAQLLEAGKLPEVEATLDLLSAQLKANPEAVGQFRFVLKAISDKLRFNLAQMQQDKSGVQLRILNKVLELGKGISDLEPKQNPSTLGRISVTSDPVGAQVYLDNIPKGVAPCVIENVTFGNHVLKLQAQGYGAISKSVSVKDRKTVREEISLKAGCSVQGRVFLPNGKPCTDANVGIFRFKNNQMSEENTIVFFKGKTDPQGQYGATGLPKEDIFLEVEREGYNSHWKNFSYSQADQGYRRTYDVHLVPLIKIAGADASLHGATIRLFKKEREKYYLVKEIKAQGNGEFVFEKMPSGSYRLFAGKEGCSIGLAVFQTTDGKDLKIKLATPPLKTVDAFVIVDKKWTKFPMVNDGKGTYSVKVPLKAAKDPYPLVFFLNKADKQKDDPETLAINPDLPTTFDPGFLCNQIEASKDGEIAITYDGSREAVWFIKSKNSEGKEIVVTSQASSLGR